MFDIYKFIEELTELYSTTIFRVIYNHDKKHPFYTRGRKGEVLEATSKNNERLIFIIEQKGFDLYDLTVRQHILREAKSYFDISRASMEVIILDLIKELQK